MPIELTQNEIRVIGCLLEKEITTPEQYPLSLNALVNACNQKSNREPAVSFSDQETQGLVDGLIKKYQISEQGGYGSRVPKYSHRFCNTEYGSLKFSAKEVAVICELFLRGPQTPGELRSRASRLAAFDDSSEVESVLGALARREDGPYVVRLPREPGRRESRYAHLFGGEVVGATDAECTPEEPIVSASSAFSDLERRVSDLEATVDLLKRQLALTALGD